MMRLLFLLTAFLGFVEGPDPSLVSDDLKQEERLSGTFDPFEDAETEHGAIDRERVQFPVAAQLSKSTDGKRQMDQSVVVWTARRHSDVI